MGAMGLCDAYFSLMILIFSSFAALAAGASVDGHGIQRLRIRDAMRELRDLSDEVPHLLEGSMSMSMFYEDPGEEAGDGGEPSPLEGTSWRAAEIPPLSIAEEPVSPITISFNDDGVYGNAGCNWYFGGVEYRPSSPPSFVVGGLATTRMYCEGAMDRERDYLALIDKGTFHFEIGEDGGGTAELVLYDDEPSRGGVIARFAEDESSESSGTPGGGRA